MTAFAAALLAAAGARAAPPVALTAQLGLVPWKAAGRIDNLANREGYERFLGRHPEVRIEEFERLWLPGQNWGAAQVMSVAGSAGPDMLVVSYAELGGYVREGLVQQVEDLWEGWEERTRWPEPLTDGLKIEGGAWGGVTSVEVAVLAGMKDAFAAAGLGEGAMPRAWSDLAPLAAKLTVRGARAGLVVPGGRTLVLLWLALARQAGAPDAAVASKEGVTVNLAADGARRAAAAIADLGTAVRAAGGEVLVTDEPGGDGTPTRRALAEGKAALGLVSTADLDVEIFDVPGGRPQFALQNLLPHLAPVPGAFAPAPLSYATGGTCAVIPRYVTSPDLRRLIWEFYATATRMGGGVEQDWLRLATVRKARVPSVFAARYPAHPLVRSLLPSAWSAPLASASAAALPPPPDLEFERLAEILAPKLAGLLRAGGDAGAALAQAQDEFEEREHLKSRRASWGWEAGAAAFLLAFVAALGFGLWRLASDLRQEIALLGAAAAERMNAQRWGMALGLFLPAALLAAGFGVLPLVNGLWMSFSAHVLRAGGVFVGLRNYLDVAISPVTHAALAATGVFLLLSFALSYVGPALLAVILSGFTRWTGVTRSVFFLPSAASAVVVAVLWRQMYDIAGPFNTVMGWLGVAPRGWLDDPKYAMAAVSLAQAWSVAGLSALTYLAGLSAVPENLYEETELAGGGLFERFTHVTLPHLLPLLGINFVGWLISAARTAEQVFLMTGGGPGRSTYVVGLDIFTQAYVNIRFGYAMAEVWMLVAVILLCSIYQMRAVRAGQLRLAAG